LQDAKAKAQTQTNVRRALIERGIGKNEFSKASLDKHAKHSFKEEKTEKERKKFLDRLERAEKKRYGKLQKEFKEKVRRKLKTSRTKVKKATQKARKKKARRISNVKRNLTRKLLKKFTMDAKKGKSVYISLLFAFFLSIALINDSTDIVLEIAGLIASLTGVGAAVLAALETVIEAIDVTTSLLLIIFSIYVGGHVRAPSKATAKILVRVFGATLIELLPIANMITSWTIIILWNWWEVRRRGERAEALEYKISQIGKR